MVERFLINNLFIYSIVVLFILNVPPVFAKAASYALLIGIEEYSTPNLLSLQGPKNDVQLMKSLLTGRFEIPPDHITTLLNEQATHTKIHEAFGQLAERVHKGDVVYIYYSGHGSKTLDSNEGDREIMGEDQTWVSYGSREDRLSGLDNWDILDDEINEWLMPIYAKTDQVIFVSDSCHSGSVSRADMTGVREAPKDIRLHPLAKKPIKPGIDVGIRIGAARDDEYAQEAEFDEKKQGKFTWYWVKALNDIKPNDTWRSVFNRASSLLVQHQHTYQQPQMSGQSDREVFGGQFVAQKPMVQINRIDADKKLAWLQAGSVVGITVGSKYKIFNTTGLKHSAAPCLKITSVDSFESWAEFNGCEPRIGDNVVEVDHAYTTKPIKLKLKTDSQTAQDKSIIADLKKELANLAGFQLVDEHDPTDWVVYLGHPILKNGSPVYLTNNHTLPVVSPEQPAELWVTTSVGQLLHDRLRIPMANNEIAKGTLKNNLVSYARVQVFKALASDDNLPLSIKVERLRSDSKCRKGCLTIKNLDGITDVYYRNKNHNNIENLAIKPPILGDALIFKAKNNSLMDDYYLYILEITPQGGIQAIFPKPGDNTDTARIVMGKKERELQRVLLLDSLGTETLKIIITKNPIDVNLFEHEELWEMRRGEYSNSLERFLTASLGTRQYSGTIEMDDWFSQQVEFEVR